MQLPSLVARKERPFTLTPRRRITRPATRSSMAIPRSAWRQFELSMLYAMVIATTSGVGFMIWGIKTGQIEKIDLDGISHKRADGRSKFAGEEPK